MTIDNESLPPPAERWGGRSAQLRTGLRWGAVVTAALLSVNASCARQNLRKAQEASGPDSVLIISADLRGYLGPCGCSEGMRGGLDRAAFQVWQARQLKASVHFLDGGDSLFGRLQYLDSEVPQEQRKAKAIAEIFQLMKLETHAVGGLDDAFGAEFRQSLHLPEQADGTFRLLDGEGQKIAVVAATTGEQLLQASRLARQKAPFVLALLHRSIEEAQQIASTSALEADLLVATHTADELGTEQDRLVGTSVPVVQIQSKGRSLARVDLFFGDANDRFFLAKSQSDVDRELAGLDERIELMKKELNVPGLEQTVKKLKGERLAALVSRRELVAASSTQVPPGRNAFTVRFVPLESTLPSLPDAKARIDAYQRDVGLLNLAWVQKHGKDCPPAPKGQASFVGNEACRDCHDEAFPVWEHSKHARAYKTLSELGRQYDLECISCHVTGFGKSGGVCRVDRVSGRENVGCESCHGPGSLHSDDPTTRNILPGALPQGCIRCHDRENSTHFEFSTFLPQILGEGHRAH